jgi:protein-tyrosine phosphatase
LEKAVERMIDLHCHMLPGIDDGASEVSVSLAMAKASVAQGITTVACTPHILPGLYHNTGPQIRQATARLQDMLDQEKIPLRLTTGSDAHIALDFIAGLRSGRVLSLGDSRYVLVEPPHHTAPPQLEDFFFNLVVAGYVPILTHPERLSWTPGRYQTIERLVAGGVWMQITAGSLTGAFGSTALYWAHRMLDEGCVHLIASDAHDTARRPQNLAAGYECAAKRVGVEEAQCLVLARPMGILKNQPPSNLPGPLGGADAETATSPGETAQPREHDQMRIRNHAGDFRGWSGRLRRLLKH